MMLRAEIPKWTKSISMSLSQQMTYKLDFFLSLTLPPLVLVIVSYALWREIFDREQIADIGGFTQSQMLNYQCWSFVVSLLVRSHRGWNLSEDIRYGRITAFLLHPFGLWKVYASQFVAFQAIQLFVAAITLTCIYGFELAPFVSAGAITAGILCSLLVSALWFTLDFLCGLLAFWLEETWILRFVFQLFTLALSGAFIPIELFPDWLKTTLKFTPFPLLTSMPVHVFMGSQSQPFFSIFGNVLIWIALSAMCSSFIWKRGIRTYSAAGM